MLFPISSLCHSTLLSNRRKDFFFFLLFFFILFPFSEAHLEAADPWWMWMLPAGSWDSLDVPRTWQGTNSLQNQSPADPRLPWLYFLCKALSWWWRGVMRKALLWGLFASPTWYPANQLPSTIQHPDLCEASRTDAFIDSNLVFQRSLHVTKRAAGVI